MRYSFSPAIAAIGLFALAGTAVAQQPATQTPAPAAQGTAPGSGTAPASQPATESKAPLAAEAKQGPEGGSQGRSQSHQQTESGRAGKDEAQAANLDTDKTVMKNGMMNVPGAPTQGAAIPSKYSERNAALDKMPPFVPRSK